MTDDEMKPRDKDFSEDQRIYDIMDACGVKENDQERIWFAVHPIVDQGQNYWYNKARAEALEEAAKIADKWENTGMKISTKIRALKSPQ